MNLKILEILIVLYFSSQNILICQNIFKNTEITLGYSILPQDRRLFDFPLRDVIIQQENSRWDFEYSAIITKNIFSNKKFNLSAGIGYSLFQTKFSRPFDHTYFTNILSKELRYIGQYLIHNFIISASPEYLILKSKNNSIYVNTPLLTRFSFNKVMGGISDSGNQWKHNKVKFEVNNFESYVGLGYGHKRVGFNIAYRIFNLQKIDRIMFPHNLYYGTSIVEKNYEINNINKLLVNLIYKIN